MVPVNMPVVGQDIPTGIIKEWLKKEGDSVSREEIIVTVESEKATFDVEATADGVLLKILRQEEEEVEVLTPIAYIGEEGESFESGIANEEHSKVKEPIPEKSPEDVFEKNLTTGINRRYVSPLAKKIAEKEGIDLDSVKGTGPSGRIIKRNVLDAIENKNSEKNVGKALPQTFVHQPGLNLLLSEGEKDVQFGRISQLIADKLVLSKQTIPHFYLFIDVEMDKALARKEQISAESKAKVTITDLVVCAVSKAIGEFPRMNSHVYSNKYVLFKDINIGLAVSSEDGLRVPVIANSDKADLVELSAQTKKLAADARIGKIDLNMKAGLTITTLGMYGINQFLPIINPPESAILAVGKSSPKVVTDGVNISIKNSMAITLACDHRLIDGAYAANFLGRVKELLEQADFRKLNW